MLRSLLTPLVVLVITSPSAFSQQKSVREMTPTRVAAKAAPLAKKECERFALAFEEALRTQDWKAAEAEFDWTALYTRATNGIPAPDKTRAAFRETADTYFRGESGLIAGIVHSIADGATFRFLRVIDNGAETRVLFRLMHQSGDVPDYISLVLQAERDGSAVATDFESAREGDLASLRLRRYFLGLSSSSTRTLEDKVSGLDKARVHWQKELESADEAFREGQNKKALEILEALPEEIKTEHSVVLARLNAARALSGEAFRTVLERVRSTLKNDVAVELIALDRFLETKASIEARRALMALNEAVGGDGYLDWLQAGIEEESGDPKAALAACRRSIAHDESLQEPWWMILAIQLRENRHSDVLTTLEAMQARFDVDWRVVERAPEYIAFFNSEFGKAWKTRLAAKK